MSDITQSIRLTLVHEGGFQNDSKDAGNWTGGKVGVGELVGTKYGITPQDMPGVDIKNITEQDAINYYNEHYVKPLYTSITSQAVLDKLFDLGVLFGVGTAIKKLQSVLPGLTPDGDFGPLTLAAVNTAGDSILQPYKTAMVSHALSVVAANPNDREFFAGWVKRINS